MSAGSVVAGLRELLEKATAEPWVLVGVDAGEAFVGMKRNPKGWWNEDSTLMTPANAELIVAMRNALPALLAVADAAKEVVRGTAGLYSGWPAARRLEEAVAGLAGREGDTG